MKLPTVASFPGVVLDCGKAGSIAEPTRTGELRDSLELSEASLGRAFLRDRPRWWDGELPELSGLNSCNVAACLSWLEEVRGRKGAAG